MDGFLIEGLHENDTRGEEQADFASEVLPLVRKVVKRLPESKPRMFMVSSATYINYIPKPKISKRYSDPLQLIDKGSFLNTNQVILYRSSLLLTDLQDNSRFEALF